LTGFFATWAFGQSPDFLKGVMAVSPTPLEPKRVLDGIMARTAPGRLFVVNGTAEAYLDSATQEFAAALNARPIPGRVFEYRRLAEVSHEQAGPQGMVPALLFMFRPVSLAGYQFELLDGALPTARFHFVFDSTRQAYVRGAHQLDLPERLPIGFLLSQRLSYQDVGLAPLLLRVCEEIITSYPALWHGPDCAGDAQLRLGRATEARASFHRAAERARAAGDTASAVRLTRKADGGGPGNELDLLSARAR
jgi:hypothetical protein